MREEKIKKLIEVKNNENWECLLKLIDYSLIYIAIYTIKKTMVWIGLYELTNIWLDHYYSTLFSSN